MLVKKKATSSFRPSRLAYGFLGMIIGFGLQSVAPPISSGTEWVMQLQQKVRAPLRVTVLTSADKSAQLEVPEATVAAVSSFLFLFTSSMIMPQGVMVTQLVVRAPLTTVSCREIELPVCLACLHLACRTPSRSKPP